MTAVVLAVILAGAAVGAVAGADAARAAPASSQVAVPDQRPAVPGTPAYTRLEHQWDAADARELLPPDAAWQSVRVGGAVRRYVLSVPPHPLGPAPLVIAFHGLSQRAGSFAGATGLVRATRAAGEVLAVPESEGPAFNDSRLGTRGPQDDAFTLAIARRLEQRGLVDPRRVVVAGFSNGAGMAMEVAGQHPHAVAAVVSVSGELIDEPGAPRPTGPVPAVLVHGTADRTQPWGGRRRIGPKMPAYISEPATVAAWVAADGAHLTTTRVLTAVHGRSRVRVQTYAAGLSGADVTFYTVYGMGHRWPLGPSGAVHRPGVYAVDATSLVVQAGATALLPATPYRTDPAPPVTEARSTS